MSAEKYYYKVYGLTLASDYKFPQFIELEKNFDDVEIIIEHGGITDDILKLIEKGICNGVKKDALWIKNEVGIFWIHDCNKINFVELDGINIDDAAVYLPGLCLSILLWYRKMLMIHGSCLRINNKTIIIAGNSGAGKSTITTELINRGALLIADDVTGIKYENGTFISYPAFPAQKLCMDQVEKNRIDTSVLRQIRYDLNKYEIPRFDKFYNKPSKVDVFFRVEVDDVAELSTNELIGSDKVRAITDSIFINWLFNDLFRFKPDDMARCIGFANQIKIYKISRNKEQDTLNKILAYIERNI